MAALAGEILRFDILAIQLIGQLHGHREFLVRGALIIDIRAAVRIPGDGSVRILLVAAVAVHIGDVLERRGILQRIRAVLIFQLIADDHLRRRTRRVRDHIDGLILAALAAVGDAVRLLLLCGLLLHLFGCRGRCLCALVRGRLAASEE